MSATEFITKMAPLAVADMGKSGVLASVTLAQAILESGWGRRNWRLMPVIFSA